jgi:type II secretory pathway pseudopilin PulG
METNELSLNQTPMSSQTQSAQTNLTNSRIIVLIIISILLTTVITGSAVYFWQKSVNEKEINSLRQEITTLKNQITKGENVETAPSPTSQPTFSVPINEPATKNFSYNNFSLNYPIDWILLDMSTSEDFPLKERLASLSNKAIALGKDGLYLIITIDQESEGGAGGIFIGDSDYNEFISSKDKVVIEGLVFYLNKNHSDIPSLLEAHSGPWMWSALAEYIPRKTTGSGNVFRGYENVIKRNGYMYNLIITSNDGGDTDSQLQGEIIDILETIEW